MSGRLRICVTNDDGIGTTGITVLAHALRGDGHDVVVVAPVDERSGAGTGLGRVVGGDAVSWTRRNDDGVSVFAIDAPPAMCVLAAMQGIAGPPPDVVVSGINHGPNLGFAVVHSGTVGAALTAHVAGVPGLAVSVGEPATGAHGASRPPDDDVWRHAASLAGAVLRSIDVWGGHWVPNINVPSTWDGRSAPVCAHLARIGAIGLAVSGDDSAVVRLHSHADLDGDGATDERWPDDLLANSFGRATITPLMGFGSPPAAQLPAIEALVEAVLR